MKFESKMSYSPSKTRASVFDKVKMGNAAKLEMETRKMEERIRTLKEKMMKEKEERERLGGVRWMSGAKGPMARKPVKKPNLKKGASGLAPRKIKVLTDEPFEHYIRKIQPVTENATATFGQCERTASDWGVDARDSAKQSISPKKDSFDFRFNKHHGVSTNTTTENNHGNGGSSLLNGSYNEEESANSFAQALLEWRNGNNKACVTPENGVIFKETSCGTATDSMALSNDNKLNIKFNSSISYGDRLYLRKNRVDGLAGRMLEEKSSNGASLLKNSENTQDLLHGNVESELHENVVDNFAQNYGEMIRNISSDKMNADITTISSDVEESHAVSVQEISTESRLSDDPDGTCIVEEYDELNEDTDTRPMSRQGTVTICEMFPSADNTINTSNTADDRSYVSPSIVSRPFFLKPSKASSVSFNSSSKQRISKERKKSHCVKNGANDSVKKKHRHSNSSKDGGGRRKLSENHDVAREEPGAVCTYGAEESGLSNIDLRTPQPSFYPKDEKRESTSMSKIPRPPSRPFSSSFKRKKTRIPTRKAWMPKPSHRELTSFFLAGVDTEEQPQKEIPPHKPRSSSGPLTLLGRGSTISTWRPVDSYVQTSTPDLVNMMSFKTRDVGKAVEDCRSTRQTVEETTKNINYEELTNDAIERKGDIRDSKDSKKENSSHKGDNLFEVSQLDDFGTGNQSDDDIATLDELAWELASSTGRLTRCEEDFSIESDVDSIENNVEEFGLSTPFALERTLRESIMDDFEEMEKKFMEDL